MNPNSKRIIGIDLARGIALLGMVIVNFNLVFHDNLVDQLKPSFVLFLQGKAAATFVVLAGIGLALMSKSKKDQPKYIQLKIIKRGAFLFIFGLLLTLIWEADILHFYGIYLALIAILFKTSNTFKLISAIMITASYPILFILFDYTKGWDFEKLHYLEFWRVEVFFLNLFFNGFHPVLPWIAFVFIGFWFGNKNLTNNAFLKSTIITSGIVLTLSTIINTYKEPLVKSISTYNVEFIIMLLDNSPMPPMPSYMLTGISVALLTISSCILIGYKFPHSILIKTICASGKMALTLYVTHIIIGMGIIESLPTSLFTFPFMIAYSFGFYILSMLFSYLWLKFFKQGPLEYIMRRI